jgi:hypothetical protein
MDVGWAQIKIDVVVGQYAGELLGNAHHAHG